jgi:hypothetical protein
VAATAKLMGVTEASITPIRERVRPEEVRGSMMPHFNIIDVFHAFEADVQGIITLEDILFPLSSVLQQGSVTAPGAGQNNYTWTFTGPTSSPPNALPLTLEWTDNVRGYQATGGLGTQLVLSGQVNQEARFRWRIRGKQVQPATAASPADRVVTPLAANLFTLSKAADAANPTYTNLANVLRQWELTIDSGLQVVPAQSGALTPVAPAWQGYRATLRLILLHRSPDGTGVLDDFLSGNLLLVRLQSGAYYGSPAAQLTVEFAGVPVSVSELFQNADGLTAFQVEIHSRYAPQWGNWLKVTVINNVSSLP